MSSIDLTHLGSGDSYLLTDALSSELASNAFTALRDEVEWKTMLHRGGEVPRLVAVQGEILDDESFPIYRHPSDQSPPLRHFTPTVSQIRSQVERILNHPVNHVLIQLYRSGKDWIGEHSDKTIDVVRGSYIVNVSIGAQRNMDLKPKKDLTSGGEKARFALPHNSIFVLGPQTNREYLHAINHDNRIFKTKSPEEKVENGERISLTFRNIGTWISKDLKLIWGQGAKGKTREDAREVVSGELEAEKMIEAFGKENHDSGFDWDKWYGHGFDVLHFVIKE